MDSMNVLQRLCVKFKTGQVEEFFATKAEFGEHPDYYEIHQGMDVIKIPTIQISGISFEKILFQ